MCIFISKPGIHSVHIQLLTCGPHAAWRQRRQCGQGVSCRKHRKSRSNGRIKRIRWPSSIQTHQHSRTEARGGTRGGDTWRWGQLSVSSETKSQSISEGSLAEAFVFTQGGDCGKCLSAIVTLDLLSAVGMHSFVSAEVGELGVRF